jgi:hypothetical protein
LVEDGIVFGLTHDQAALMLNLSRPPRTTRWPTNRHVEEPSSRASVTARSMTGALVRKIATMTRSMLPTPRGLRARASA